jgi:hypothetical protein
VLNVTPPVKPPVRVMVTVYVVLAPRTTVWLAGDALSVKSGAAGAVTVSVTLVVRLSVPLVPVIVSGYEPAGVVVAVVTVSVDDAAVAGFGLYADVAPAGSPVVLSVTAPVKPPTRLMLTVYVPLDPCTTDWLAGVALSE